MYSRRGMGGRGYWKEEALMTNRMTSQDSKTEPRKPQLTDFSRYKVCDSYCNPPSVADIPDGGRHRLSRRQLEELDACLKAQDKEALLAIQRHRYLMTGQAETGVHGGCYLYRRPESCQPLPQKAKRIRTD